jgi:hypothetical protein
MITRLNLDDKWRKKILERKGAPETEIVEEKPKKKEAKKKTTTSKTTKKTEGK